MHNSQHALVLNETRDIMVRYLVLRENNGHTYQDALNQIDAAGRSLSQTIHKNKADDTRP